MPRSRTRHRAAFALIPALLLTSLVFAVVFSLACLTLAQRRENESALALAQARAAALAGTRLALADLQTYTGTDDCATAKITSPAPGHEWVGAWHGKRILREFPERVALVSNRGIFTGTRSARIQDKARMNAPAEVPWEMIGENVRIAYFIEDESLRASIAKRERRAHLERFADAPDELTLLRQQVPRRAHLAHIFEDGLPEDDVLDEKLEAAPDEKILLAELCEPLSKNRRAAAREAFTLDARAVPADWPRRTLKLDLSDEKSAPEAERFLPPSVLKSLRAEKIDLAAGTPAATSVPAPDGALGHVFAPFPIPAEIKLHVGVFNPRSDGQHRARFHVTLRLWNPYAFPLLAQSDGSLGLFDVEDLPMVCIRNENTNGEIVFSPSDFPVGRFGLVRQTPSDKTCNAYCRIFDATPQGFGARGNAAGLHGGEVFLARFPDPRAQPVGLSRNTGGSSWRYQKDPAKISKPPSGAKSDAWFHPAHEISVVGLPSIFPASFLIRGYAGTLPQAMLPERYAEPVFAFRNVEFPGFSVRLSGAEYNREKAGDYDVSQATFVWKIRLRAEDADAMNALFAAVDPRLGVFDFSVPAVRDAFEISVSTGADARAEAELGGAAETPARNASPLRDRFPNEHALGQENAFACVRLFDAPPTADALSVGALRHCAFDAFPPKAGLGEPFPRSGKTAPAARGNAESPNAIFDRAYFSASGKNPHHFPAGEAQLVSGAFNFNSENADAWAATLAHDVPAWTPLAARGRASAGKSAARARNLERAFFTLPFSARNSPAPESAAEVFSDGELAALSAERRERVLLAQGVREIELGTLKNFSTTLAALLSERRARGNAPFRSMEEFLDSGLVKAALAAAGVNRIAGEDVPAWAPAAISQAALAESLAPCSVPRGDTFTILCRAEVFDPVSKKIRASACAKMRVQRGTEFFDASQPAGTPDAAQNAVNRAFGRRYAVESFRQLPHDEL